MPSQWHPNGTSMTPHLQPSGTPMAPQWHPNDTQRHPNGTPMAPQWHSNGILHMLHIQRPNMLIQLHKREVYATKRPKGSLCTQK